jgi:hypothetical protein
MPSAVDSFEAFDDSFVLLSLLVVLCEEKALQIGLRGRRCLCRHVNVYFGHSIAQN